MKKSKFISKRRQQLGLLLEDVAKALDVTVMDVHLYELRGLRSVESEKIKLLAEVLQCSPIYLMGYSKKINDPVEQYVECGKMLYEMHDLLAKYEVIKEENDNMLMDILCDKCRV